ncbi:hypothetical protein [Paraburkholderia humisilvae]|nr:hypothetical protein [Paraburkholderia humisilvae]
MAAIFSARRARLAERFAPEESTLALIFLARARPQPGTKVIDHGEAA